MKPKHYIPPYFFFLFLLGYALYSHAAHYTDMYGNCIAYDVTHGFFVAWSFVGLAFLYRKLVCSLWP